VPAHILQRGPAVRLVRGIVTRRFDHDVLVHHRHVMIESLDVFLFGRKNARKLVRKLIDIGIETNPVPVKVDAVKEVMLNHINGLFQTVKHKPVRIESLLTEAVHHRRPLIEGHMVSLKNAARTARVITLFDHGDAEVSFGQKTCCRKT